MEPIMLNNRYRLIELVGSGGMAMVYRGVDTLLQRRVAVKVLRESFAGDPAFLARFQREARAAANLDHPNIVTVYDVGQDGERHYIVMEYVDGQDLKTLIRQRGRLSIDEALSIALQVAGGVGHAHKAGIIHCDIKPQNVLVTQDGRTKVADFGIARALSESGLTESETVWGSPHYFSPEQAAGDPPSPASDVYSVGVVMYEMLSGEPPFQAESPAALALMHMREEPVPLAARNPQVPPQLEWIIHTVMAKEPAARYHTAEQLAHVLDEYRKYGEQVTGWQPMVTSAEYTGYAAAARQPSVPQQSSDRLTWILGAIAFVAVMGLIPLWIVVYQAFRPAPPPSLPTRTPIPLVTLTPEVKLIPVPNVVGKPIDEARDLIRRAGLQVVLLEERDEPGVEHGIVLEQSPAPNERVPLDTEVSIVVSSPGQDLTMPDLLNYALEDVRGGIEKELDLRVVVQEEWSAEPEGLIIAQEPDPETTIHAGDTVTLTVSGGTDVPILLEVQLADVVVLESVELDRRVFQPGDVIEVALNWQVLRATTTHYVVFVHLIDASDQLVSQQDVEPGTPTTEWGPGLMADLHRIEIPVDSPQGLYQLRVGLYRQGEPHIRLPVIDPGRTTAESDSILIAEIEVQR